jgi:hypothetical protein
MRHLHLALTLGWVIAIIPTSLWWKTSILWVGLMSCYANVAGHWSAYQASRAEQTTAGNGACACRRPGAPVPGRDQQTSQQTSEVRRSWLKGPARRGR